MLANNVLTELGVQARDRDAADKTAAFLTTLVDTRTRMVAGVLDSAMCCDDC